MISFLDVVLGATLLFFLVRGVFRGLLREIASTVGVLAGWWTAVNYSHTLAPYLESFFEDPAVLGLVCYILVFFGVMLGAMLLICGIAKLVHMTPSGWVDVPGGAMVGVAKGWILGCVVLLGLNIFMPEAEFVAKSKLVPYFQPGADFLQQFVPEELRNFDPLAFASSLQQGDSGAGFDFAGKARELLDSLLESIKNMISTSGK